MVEVGNIITLDDGSEYHLIDKNIFDGKEYFFAVGATDLDEVVYDDILFFEKIVEDGEEYVERVEEDTAIFNLLKNWQFIKSTFDIVPGAKQMFQDYIDDLEKKLNIQE